MSYWDEDEISEAERAFRYYTRTCPWCVQEMMELNGYEPVHDDDDDDDDEPTGTDEQIY